MLCVFFESGLNWQVWYVSLVLETGIVLFEVYFCKVQFLILLVQRVVFSWMVFLTHLFYPHILFVMVHLLLAVVYSGNYTNCVMYGITP